MNKKILIIGIAVGALTLGEGFVLFASYKTTLFQKSAPDIKKLSAADSLKQRGKRALPGQTLAAQTAVRDTVKNNQKPAIPPKDTINGVQQLQTTIQSKSDSIAILSNALAVEQKKSKDLSDQLKAFTMKQTTLQDQKRKELQKIYNTMDAESAARIVEKLSDQDILDILLSVQKRQAAKILASLDPNRAAKLINQINTTN